MERGATFPPARIKIVWRDLVETELFVIVRTDPFGRVNGPFLQCRIDVAAGDLLGHHTELLQRLAGPAAYAELEPFEIVDGLDVLAKPAAHLRAGIAADEAIHVGFLRKLIH